MLDFALSFLVFLVCAVLIQVVLIFLGVIVRELVIKPVSMAMVVLITHRHFRKYRDLK